MHSFPVLTTGQERLHSGNLSVEEDHRDRRNRNNLVDISWVYTAEMGQYGLTTCEPGMRQTLSLLTMAIRVNLSDILTDP